MKKIIILSMFALVLITACTGKEAAMQVQKNENQSQSVSRAGNGDVYQGVAEIFTGNVFVQPVYPEMSPSKASGAYVTFEAGARSNWHNHPAGQTLVVTDGIAWTNEWNGASYEAHAGEIIHCPPNVKHWHGASPYGPMTHVSIVESINSVGVTWLEAVTDEQYEAVRNAIAAKNVNVKNIDVKRQSIVTISAFTAAGDIGRLKVALNEGLDNKLTVNEIKEVIVQLYAYAGFPRCLNALTTFFQIVQDRGNKDTVGEAGKALAANINKLAYGTKVQTELVGGAVSGAIYDFAPAADIFLKEHLFADIFGRGVLSYQDREVATIAALANIAGAGAQLGSHMNIGLNTGLTKEQIRDIVTIIDSKVGKKQGADALKVFETVTTAK